MRLASGAFSTLLRPAVFLGVLDPHENTCRLKISDIPTDLCLGVLLQEKLILGTLVFFMRLLQKRKDLRAHSSVLRDFPFTSELKLRSRSLLLSGCRGGLAGEKLPLGTVRSCPQHVDLIVMRSPSIPISASVRQ